MDQPDGYRIIFSHLHEYRVIVCKACQFAVVPSQIKAHLSKHHPNIPPKTRQSLAVQSCQLENLAHVESDVVYPDPRSAAIKDLPIYKDGFACVASDETQQPCGYICRTVRGIQEHCKKQHGWINSQKRGGNMQKKYKNAANKLWQEGQICQRFFEVGQWKRFFKVAHQERISEGRESIVEQGEQLLDRRIAQIEEDKKRREVEEPTNRFVVNTWLEHTGWQSHLAGFEKEQLKRWIQPAIGEQGNSEEHDFDEGEGEVGLADACRATRRLIRKAMEICNPKNVDRSALHYVNRKETGAKSYEEPFDGGYKVNTIRKYSDSWVKLLRYIWRTHRKEQRPCYYLTDEQAESMGVLIDLCSEYEEEEEEMRDTGGVSVRARQRRRIKIKERREAIEKACLDFWITIFDHEIKDKEFECGIISGLAILGSDSVGTEWAQAIHFTPKLSAIITVLRALIIYRAFSKRKREVQRLQKDGRHSEMEARRKARSIFDRVQIMVHKLMILTDFGGKPGPIDRIFHMRTYGQRIRYTTHAEGKVSWQDDKILIDKLCFSMDDVRSMIQGLLNDVQTSLYRDLMLLDLDSTGKVKQGTTQLPALDLNQIYDNPAEMSDGWNFLQDTRSKFSVEGKRWLWRRVLGEDRLRDKFIRQELGEADSAKDIVWNSKGVKDYMAKVTKFKEQLFVLVHMTGGGPARGPEIVSIQHENGVDDRGYRGVFVEGGLVSFVTSYHKGYRKNKKAKIIHRYVPQEVSEIVVYYLWLVEPLIRYIQILAEDRTDFKAFVWEPAPEEGWKVGEDDNEVGEEEEELEEVDNEEGQGQESTRNRDEWSDEEGDDEEGEDEEGDHNRGGGRNNNRGRPVPPEPSNPDGFWDNNRVRKVMQAESSYRMNNKLSASIWRNAYPAIHRELTRKRDVVETLDLIYEDREAGEDESTETSTRVRANQSGHSFAMEEGIYGRSMTESPFHTMAERQKFRSVSVDWHRILRFPSAWKDDKMQPETKRQMQAEQEQEEFERWRTMRKTDLTRKLKQMMGPNAEFRGLQERALQAIMQRHMRVLIMMRTGGGKSLFFMLPAMCSRDGVTIVIVPLISLREDLKRRCDEAGISCAEWDTKRPPRWANVVLTTPEAAVGAAFGRFIDEKRMMKQLDRIVIDECHVVLDSTADWRPDILKLVEMTEKQTQVIYLTATLPPKDEPRFFDIMGLKEEEVTTFRDTTTRKNIEYKVVEYEDEREEEEVKRLVEEKKREHPLPGQIIVYCKEIKQAVRLAEVLGCRVYHREVGTEVKKREILAQLTAGKEQVFTATNALGLGIDAPTIRTVIHVGIRERMRDYAQESGRAGRDGKKSEAIIMRKVWTGRDGGRKIETGWRMEKAMKEFLEGDSCRRIILDKEMDGRTGRLGCEIGEERCDICQGKPRGTRRVRSVVQNRQQEEEEEEEEEEVEMMSPYKRRVEFVDSGLGMSSSSIIGRGVSWTQDGSDDEEEEEEEEERLTREEGGYPSSPPILMERGSQHGLGIDIVGDLEDEDEEGDEEEEDEEEDMWHQFQLEKKQEEIKRQRKIEDGLKGQLKLEGLRQQFDEWEGCCVICKAKGREQVKAGHKWQDCRVSVGDVNLIREAIKAMESVSFERFSCCGFCWAPQSICHRWIADSKRIGLHIIRAGGVCQYPTTLRDAVIAILTFRAEECDEWIEVEQQKRGLEEGSEDEWIKMKRWLGLKIKIGRIEMSEMCRLFYIFG